MVSQNVIPHKKYFGGSLLYDFTEDCIDKKSPVPFPTEIADLLHEEGRACVEELERKLRKKIVMKGKAGFHQQQFNIIEI